MLKRTDLIRITGRRGPGDHLYVVQAVATDDFTGVTRISAHPLIPRLYLHRETPEVVEGLMSHEVQRLATPTEALSTPDSARREAWPTRTRQTIERLFALWLLHEDRKNLLDASKVDHLAHQVSLLEYVKKNDLQRLLIADEVGLGKTIEAGMMIRWVLDTSPNARILYLAPAMLVDNVFGELKRMETPARIDRYSAVDGTVNNGELQNAQIIVASIHRASLRRNEEFWTNESGSWDLIIVDECHHLSDWSNDGTSPKEHMRLVKNIVNQRLKQSGRLVLMSATPHQGSSNKFRNLLRLLSDEPYGQASGDLNSVAGRVVYRTKEDVRDWDNRPLFSKRKVNEPTFVQLDEEYHDWLETIGNIFIDADFGPAAWRRAQAMQWAASSPKAGLAYLTRLALRNGFDFDNDDILWDVAESLRPYRTVSADAPIEDVRAVLERQTRAPAEQDDQESADDSQLEIDRDALIEALELGIALVQSGVMQTKLQPLLEWITNEDPSKFVVFATPIETVDEIRLGLEAVLGSDAVITITGEMNPAQRRAQMQKFRNAGVRALVASKAGSEGINLQVAHRLIHFDVPWNPMEMEQRVGRVHRYGSTRTVVVDTLVVKDSREDRMLSRCRARLGQIIGDLFGEHAEGRFDEMYARIMTQVSGEELAELMASEGFDGSNDRLDELVQAGFEGWQASDRELRKAVSNDVHELPDRGETRESDLEQMFPLIGGKPEEGWSHVHLVERDGERREESTPANVWWFPGEKKRRVSDRMSSLSVRGPIGFSGEVERIGLNHPSLSARLRDIVGGGSTEHRAPRQLRHVDGAGAVRVPEDDWSAWLKSATSHEGTDLTVQEYRKGGVLLVWSVRLLHRGTRTQVWSGMHAWIRQPRSTSGHWLSVRSSSDLFRLLWRHKRKQNLQTPPHHRVDNAGFTLDGINDEAVALTRSVLQISNFDRELHDIEIVPVACLTIEPRNESPSTGGDQAEPVVESDFSDEVLVCDSSQHRPPSDILERLSIAVTSVSLEPAAGPGEHSLFGMVLLDSARPPSDHDQSGEWAYCVHVAATDAGVVNDAFARSEFGRLRETTPYKSRGDSVVGFLRLDERYLNIPRDAATTLVEALKECLTAEGIRTV